MPSEVEVLDDVLLKLGSLEPDQVRIVVAKIISATASELSPDSYPGARREVVNAALTALGTAGKDEVVPTAKNLIAILGGIISVESGYRAAFEFLSTQADNALRNGNDAGA